MASVTSVGAGGRAGFAVLAAAGSRCSRQDGSELHSLRKQFNKYILCYILVCRSIPVCGDFMQSRFPSFECREAEEQIDRDNRLLGDDSVCRR